MTTFQIQPINRFHSEKASIKRPIDLACFSFDDKHELFIDDDRSLRYYYPCPERSDLSNGFNTFEKWTEEDEHLTALLETLTAFEKREGRKVDAKFITWRGMVTKFMTLPYNLDESWEMNATRFQGTIFIEEDFPRRVERNATQDRQWKPRPGQASPELMSYWGYKFETISTLPQPWADVSRDYIESRDKLHTSNLAQYCQLVETGVGDHSMVIGGEIDAVWDIKRSDRTNWVELKTSAEIRNEGAERRFEQKLLKFWAQSFLLGVQYIIVGFRDQNGVVTTIQEFQTTKIPSMVSGRYRSWDRNLCIKFTSQMLSAIDDTIKGEGVWKIRHDQGSPNVSITQTSGQGTGQILTQTFLDWRSDPKAPANVDKAM